LKNCCTRNQYKPCNFIISTDEQLIREVGEIRHLTPNIGQRRLLGALRARGIRIQRW
jgi:hypothetical protein